MSNSEELCGGCDRPIDSDPEGTGWCTKCNDALDRHIKERHDKVIDYARASVAYLNSGHHSKREEVGFFLSVFHPEMSSERRREILIAVG